MECLDIKNDDIVSDIGGDIECHLLCHLLYITMICKRNWVMSWIWNYVRLKTYYNKKLNMVIIGN